MMSNRRTLILLLWLTLAACTSPVPDTALLTFSETEPGGSPYPVRMLVTSQYLRIEDGDGRSGYILFDRQARTIYSVNHEARNTLVLKSRPVTLKVPDQFELKTQRDPEVLPPVDGKAVVHYRLTTNGKTCSEVYAAEGLLPQAVAALREYHETLAGEQAQLQANIPASFQSDCDLADYVFHPARYLDQGFPVRTINHGGVVRQLTDYKQGVPVEVKLFELPNGYEQITPMAMRNKK